MAADVVEGFFVGAVLAQLPGKEVVDAVTLEG
jgi:hypothetical protein